MTLLFLPKVMKWIGPLVRNVRNLEIWQLVSLSAKCCSRFYMPTSDKSSDRSNLVNLIRKYNFLTTWSMDVSIVKYYGDMLDLCCIALGVLFALCVQSILFKSIF